VRSAVLTISDRVTRGEFEDGSGDTLVELLEGDGYEVVARKTVPDEREQIAEAIREHVRSHPVEAWIDAQLADFDRVGTTIGR
jgi:molybdenum cofactor biosynthesis protein B